MKWQGLLSSTIKWPLRHGTLGILLHFYICDTCIFKGIPISIQNHLCTSLKYGSRSRQWNDRQGYYQFLAPIKWVNMGLVQPDFAKPSKIIQIAIIQENARNFLFLAFSVRFCCKILISQRLENWGARRAAFRPYFLRSHDRNHCICKGFGDYKGKIVPSIVPSFRNRLFLYYRLGMLNA